MTSSSREPEPGSSNNPPPSAASQYRQMRSEMVQRTGITFFATVSGIACYYGAESIGLSQTVAAIAGLVFALLVWIASRSLARDFRNRATRGQTNRDSR
jgi:hypothetical protein